MAFAGGKSDDGTVILEQVDLTLRKTVARATAGAGNLVVRKDHRGIIWTSAGDPKLRAWSAANLRPMAQVSLAARAIDFDVVPGTPLACV